MMTAIMQTIYAESYDVSVMRPGRSVRFDKMLFDYALKRPDLEPRDQLLDGRRLDRDRLPEHGVQVFESDRAAVGEHDRGQRLCGPQPRVP